MDGSDYLPLYRHPAPHRELVRRYRHYAHMRGFRASFLASFAFFFASVAVSFYAIQYATNSASSSVTDLVLSNTPALDIDALFAVGTVVFIGFVALLLLAHPKRIPLVLNGLALFWIIRSGFITLTHIGPFPVETSATGWGTILGHYLFSGDLFFSGHVGAPFLMALIFWREPYLRYVFLAWSVFFAFVVLAGHLHYSIDVASAYFITYTIFCIAVWLFPKAHDLFLSDVPVGVR